MAKSRDLNTPSGCLVCQHPERQAIEQALALGKTGHAVADSFGLPRKVVNRHRQLHMIRAVAAVMHAREMPPDESLLQALARKRKEVERLGMLAEYSSNIKTALEAISTYARLVELECKISGARQESSTVIIQQSPQALSFMARIINALAKYPDARAAVVRALEGVLPIEGQPSDRIVME